ncbi:MAG: hypothetical protein JST40_09255 [Armatimonadetes bacterium]|nr:hypothetical protein [Armatimonadota bacterium]
MKIRSFVPAVLLLSAVALVGCGGGHSVVGKWKVDGIADSGLPAGTTVDMEFKGDKSVEAHAEFTQMNTKLKMTMVGNYKQEGDTIDMTWNDLQLHAEDKKTDSMLQTMMGAQKETALKNMNEASNKGTIAWESGDKFTSKGANNKVVTFTRIK